MPQFIRIGNEFLNVAMISEISRTKNPIGDKIVMGYNVTYINGKDKIYKDRPRVEDIERWLNADSSLHYSAEYPPLFTLAGDTPSPEE